MKMKNKILPGIILLIVLVNALIITAQSSTTETEFYNSFTDPFCYIPIYDGEPAAFEAYWVDDSGMYSSMDNCYNELAPLGGQDCCPISASICDRGTNICIQGAQHCSELDETECNRGYPIIATNDLQTESNEGLICNDYYGVPYGGVDLLCNDYVSCQCKWDEDRGCEAVAEQQIFYAGTGVFYNYSTRANVPSNCSSGIDRLGDCSFSFDIIDNCETIGFLDRGWTTIWGGVETRRPDYCEAGGDRVPCLDVVKLDFFSIRNLIIAVIIIIIIYIIKKRKR
tara:strand:- start:466 stop:1314 length:849 start_codon:yes stop_codon:yes gene_type:complete